MFPALQAGHRPCEQGQQHLLRLRHLMLSLIEPVAKSNYNEFRGTAMPTEGACSQLLS